MSNGSIRPVNIGAEMREAYLDYAMSVIVSRALPDARDGLKPVHRRILYAMYDMGLLSDTSHRKSARIVGEVLGKYHPHGDAAVYDTMVRLAQDFSMRYPLVDGQGNFGSIDGDSAAAMRYTEARMTNLGEQLLIDINKETVGFSDNFDGSLQEPDVLPANFPNLLVNGASGIAVGMSTSIPPHNMNEVCNALVYMLNKWEGIDDINITDLMAYIQGPDFPTGGLVYRHLDGLKSEQDTLVAAYATGRGKITVRAKVYIEEIGRGKSQVIITELPYQVNKSSLIERIATLVRDGKIEGISDLRDESDRQGMRIVIELQRGADINQTLGSLFKLTPLQETFSINMLALVDGQPRTMNLKQALRVYLEHRLTIVQRRSEYDLKQAQERAHILEGLLVALDNLDEAIAIIRKSRHAESARNNLIKALKVSEIQAQAILDMRLRRLAALERKKIEEEHREKVALIDYLSDLLAHPEKMRAVIAAELQDIQANYSEPRRTIIIDETATTDISTEDFLIPEEMVWITVTVDGKVTRLLDNTPPRITNTNEPPPQFILEATTNHVLYVCTTGGMAANYPVQQLPATSTPNEGASFSDLLPLNADDEIAAIFSLPTTQDLEGYIFMATDSDQVKRVRIADLPGVTNKAFTIMNVGKSKLLSAFTTNGTQEVMLVTQRGQAIRFNEDNVRATGLPSGGMRGIKLQHETDGIVGAFRLPDDTNAQVWNITDDGIAKISGLDEYPLQGRAGQGVISMRIPERSQAVVAATVGQADENIVLLTSKHKTKYMRIGLAEEVKRGRAGYADPIIALRKNEQVKQVVIYQYRLNENR